jgi:hypothetical protein
MSGGHICQDRAVMLLNLVSAQHFLLGRLLDANESGPIQRSFLRRFAID